MMEPHAPGGARVHPKHTVSLGDERLVTVTVDDYSRVRTRHGVDQSVNKVYPHASQVHVHPQRQAELSELRVIVPRYGRHRRDALECGEHSLDTDVTGVEDKGDAPKRGRHSRVKVPMRVRYQPNQHRLRL